ncbi:MAG: hypothetical protein ACRDTF_04995 [Pseudonocardiaceae bacterium]
MVEVAVAAVPDDTGASPLGPVQGSPFGDRGPLSPPDLDRKAPLACPSRWLVRIMSVLHTTIRHRPVLVVGAGPAPAHTSAPVSTCGSCKTPSLSQHCTVCWR